MNVDMWKTPFKYITYHTHISHKLQHIVYYRDVRGSCPDMFVITKAKQSLIVHSYCVPLALPSDIGMFIT